MAVLSTRTPWGRGRGYRRCRPSFTVGRRPIRAAGILTELGQNRDTHTGTPQGGILSPLLFNIAMSVLDEQLHGPWSNDGEMSTTSRRVQRRRQGLPNWRIVRYCDDFVVLVRGARSDVEDLHEEIARVLAPLDLRLSPAKTGSGT